MPYATIENIEVEYSFDNGSLYSYTCEPVSPSVLIHSATIGGLDAYAVLEATVDADDRQALSEVLESLDSVLLDRCLAGR